MGKTRRVAMLLGLSVAFCVDAAPALADLAKDEAAANKSSSTEAPQSPDTRREARGATKEEIAARRAERQEKRRGRLEQGAKRLRERAAELRRKAGAGETPTEPANSKRPTRSFEEQAQRLEEQANKMEERSKNLDKEDEANPSRDRNNSSARQRRHQVRRGHLNRRWGATLKDPVAMAELKVHAERIAKLKRIRILALQKSKDDPAAARATELLTKEEARHEKRMTDLHGKSSPATAPASQEEAK